MIRIVKIDDILRIVRAPVRPWQILIFHHTATDADFNKHYGKEIDEFHRKERHWQHGMGYDFLINPDGIIEIGDRWIYQLDGAHCLGYNDIAIGIAMVGNFDKDKPTIDQIEIWQELRKMLQPRPVYPHCIFRSTACPGALFTEDIRSWFGLTDKPAL